MGNIGKRCATLVIGSSLATYCLAQVRLPALVGNDMVLQREAKIVIWGWAAPGENVQVRFQGHHYAEHAGTDSLWTIVLPPQPAGGPFTMDIDGLNHLHLKNILVGDVWFCSGQSNMVLSMERIKEKYPDEIAHAQYPQIRNFFVPTAADVERVHRDLPPGHWVAADSSTVLGFGGVSWFFARALYDRYHVPIGIINASVGGTPIQAWISAEGIRQVPDYAARWRQLQDTGYLRSQMQVASPKLPRLPPDAGTSGPKPWFDTTYIPEGWHPFWLPGYWADQGVRGLNGVVWFRKEIDLPESMTGRPATLYMGRIVDADEAYVNGVLAGRITYQYPPRRYALPVGSLKPGRNVIVVRVTNTEGKGGFVPDKTYALVCGDQRMDLRGDWQYKVGQVFPPPPADDGEFSAQEEPTGLYNTMVAPAIRYAVKGFVWYQGEANASKPEEYGLLLRTLIDDWRDKWKEGPLPVLYVQLPNFMEVQYSPSESQWAVLRDEQRKVLSVPGTAMAVTIDAGEWNDIHPLDKKDVGQRLALTAENLAYGEKNVVCSGPLFQTAMVHGDSIIVTFGSVGSGLVAKDGAPLEQFAIAGSDKKFVWAKAVIRNNQVVVFSDEVPHPQFVRYAWADNPEGANLYNKEGLPASPFRTDGP